MEIQNCVAQIYQRPHRPFCCHPARNAEESRAILGEWENDRATTLTHLESQGDDVFDSVVLYASRTGPVLKKTVLDYRYGQHALFWLLEDFVYDLKTATVSDYFLIKPMLIVSWKVL